MNKAAWTPNKKKWLKSKLIDGRETNNLKKSGVTHGAQRSTALNSRNLMLIVYLFRPISQAWDAYLLYIYMYV